MKTLITQAQLDEVIEAVNKKKSSKHNKTMSQEMRKAVSDILVHGERWRTTAIRNNVTESGICRAIGRIKGHQA
jgi:hypothetical protein